jgi:hypothetical protein
MSDELAVQQVGARPGGRVQSGGPSKSARFNNFLE